MAQKIEPYIKNAKQGTQDTRINQVILNLSSHDENKIADMICHLGKRIEELDFHLDSLNILTNKTITDIKTHPLKKTLLSIYDPFKESFQSKQIKVNFGGINEETSINIDFKIFNLVMHHFFDNATKYSRDEDEIIFQYSKDQELVIKMHSLTIEDDQDIFNLGFSGANTKDMAGNGIGMHIIKKGLNIMEMDIKTSSTGTLNKNKQYSKNIFVITTNMP